MRQILIDIDVDGQVVIEAVGFRGRACEKATAAIEAALGRVGRVNHKPEYYAQEQAKAVQSVGGGK